MNKPLIARSRALVLLAALVAGLILLLASAVDAGGPPAPPVEHRVGAGETLWSIATDASEDGDDVRELVADIKDLNDVSAATLQVGQVLLVPSG